MNKAKESAKQPAAPRRSQGAIAENELRRQQRMLYTFTAILVPYDLAYGYLWFHHGDPVLGTILTTSGIIQFVNWAAYLWHRRIDIAKPAVTLTSIFNLASLLFGGGIERTGIYWVFLFPPLTYLYQGVRLGLAYNLAFALALIGVTVSGAKGLTPLAYGPGEIKEMWSALICMNLLGYFAESGWDKSRRLLADQAARLGTLVDELPLGILVTEKDGTRTTVNAELERILGTGPLPPGSVYDPTEIKVFHLDGSPYTAEQLPTARVLKTGQSVRGETFMLRRTDGTSVVLRTSVAPIKDAHGRVMASVAAYEDMTREAELDRAKTELVSVASHQLKTPLTNIRWSVETLIGEEGGRLSPQQKEAVVDIRETVARLTRIINDFLSVARIEDGTQSAVGASRVEVGPVLKAIVEEFAAPAGRRRVSLELGKLPAKCQVPLSALAFHEIIENLLSNAIKYSLDGGRVVIEVSLAPDNSRVSISVRDNGIGIPKEEVQRVYQKFYRASNVPREAEGTGLGLYIVKTLAARAGGTVRFESEPGAGSTFSVDLPVVKPA